MRRSSPIRRLFESEGSMHAHLQYMQHAAQTTNAWPRRVFSAAALLPALGMVV